MMLVNYIHYAFRLTLESSSGVVGQLNKGEGEQRGGQRGQAKGTRCKGKNCANSRVQCQSLFSDNTRIRINKKTIHVTSIRTTIVRLLCHSLVHTSNVGRGFGVILLFFFSLTIEPAKLGEPYEGDNGEPETGNASCPSTTVPSRECPSLVRPETTTRKQNKNKTDTHASRHRGRSSGTTNT